MVLYMLIIEAISSNGIIRASRISKSQKDPEVKYEVTIFECVDKTVTAPS